MRSIITSVFIISISILLGWFAAVPVAYAQEQDAQLAQLSSIMDNMIAQATSIQEAFSPKLGGAIARTARLEVNKNLMPEFEKVASEIAARPATLESATEDPAEARFQSLMDTARATDPTASAMLPIMLELCVKSVVVQCMLDNISAETVAKYVLGSSSSFVADQGNFLLPGFDPSKLKLLDQTRIYFAGFGLVVLLGMDGGTDKAIELYKNSTELKPFYTEQLVMRGADLDMAGLPLLQAIFLDPVTSTLEKEVLFSTLAEKITVSTGQYGEGHVYTDEWKKTIDGWVIDQIGNKERLDARRKILASGIDFSQAESGPEGFLGTAGPVAEPEILSLLNSDEAMKQVSGLQAILKINEDTYPDYAAKMYDAAEPMMESDYIGVAVGAMSVFELDSVFSGEQYSDSRRARLQKNIPSLCVLLNKALGSQILDTIYTKAWLYIAAEKSLIDQLDCAMPMVAKTIVAAWHAKQNGEEMELPEGDVRLLCHFMPGHKEYFESTSEAVLGFLDAELGSGEVNPFRVWTYVTYLQTARDAGNKLDDKWLDAVGRLRGWVETGKVPIRKEELKVALEGLLK
jgi:hypothetical protein